MNKRIKSIRGESNSSLLLALAIITVIIVIGLFSTMGIRTVAGNEVGVKETWSGGVDPVPLPPRTYWINRWTETIYTYPTSGQVFVMNDKDESTEPIANGRRFDSLEVNSLDNQKVEFHISLTWHIDPEHAVALHKSYRDNIEERLIRPEVVNEVGIRATLQNAIDLYSGEKLNELRSLVTQELKNPAGKLAQSGVIVDRFVVEKPKLNPDYEKIIEQRQLAIATESQAKEQQKANVALADSAKAAALKVQYETIVAAQTQAQMTVIAQQAESDKMTIQTKADALNAVTRKEGETKAIVLQAEADARKAVVVSEAARESEVNRSVGILAVGKATAEAQKLQLQAYAVAGTDSFVRIKVSENMAAAYSGVKGYLPEHSTYNILTDNFVKGVSVLTGGNGETPPSTIVTP